MTRIERVGRLVAVAGEKSDQAAQRLAECLRNVDANETQLTELHRFRDEYSLPASPETNIAALLNRRRFIERINEAITFQLARVEQLRRDLIAERERFRALRAQSRAMDGFIRKLEDQQRGAHDQHEQSLADERAQRRLPGNGEDD